MKTYPNKHMRALALLLSVVLLFCGNMTVFAAQDADVPMDETYTLEYYDNHELRCSVLIVTCHDADGFGFAAGEIPAVSVAYIDQFGRKAYAPIGEYGSNYPQLYQQVFEQDGKLYPQLFIRLPDYLPDGSNTPRKLPMTTYLTIPAGIFRTAAGKQSEMLQVQFSRFHRIQFSMELKAEKLTYDNKAVAKTTELTPTFLCDGVCAEAYGKLVRYYEYSAPQFDDLDPDRNLSVPFTADGNIDISAVINPCAFCNGFLEVTGYGEAYRTGLRDQILKDSWKILPCFLLAIPCMFVVAWPGIWLGPILLSAGVQHTAVLFRSIFAPLTPNTGGFRLQDRGFTLTWYRDGLNGGGMIRVP